MRWTTSSIGIAALLAVASCCRERSSTQTVDASASAVASASGSAAVETVAPLRFEAPFAALLRGERVRVAGVRRGAKTLAIASLAIDSSVGDIVDIPADELAATKETKLEDVDLLEGTAGLALITDHASGLSRARRGADVRGLTVAAWETIDVASCATKTSLVTLGRGEHGLVAMERSLGNDAAPTSQAIAESASTSLLCTPGNAFVLREDGAKRIATRVGGDHADVSLADDAGVAEEQTISYQADGDGLLVTRVGAKSGFAFRSWRGTAESPTAWSSPIALPEDVSIELVIANDDDIGLVVSHPVPAARECKNGEDTDVVADVSLIARDTGKARREHDRLERWTCGADAGPFFGGAIDKKLVVSWPRGVDAACAKVGARFGGLSFAQLSATGAPRVDRRDAPCEAIEDAGCDGARCAVVVLTRFDGNACVPSTSPAAGEAKVVVYP